MDISEILKQVDTVAYSRWPMREVTGYSFSFAELQKFADLVAAAEREACAKVADSLLYAHSVAPAIRARK